MLTHTDIQGKVGKLGAGDSAKGSNFAMKFRGEREEGTLEFLVGVG
jgi:hypothetical protein